MKATINPDGLLTVTTDNETEAYALRQWVVGWGPATTADAPTIACPNRLCIAWYDLDNTAT
jgi:hypothetical protein